MQSKQYFLFISNNDIYAIEAMTVVEIVEYQHITKVPMMSSFIKGVTNIRGNIIAVVDLLERFEIKQTIITDKTSFAVVKKLHNNKEIQIALIIDEVYEVEDIQEQNLAATPDFGTSIDKRFIKYMAKYNDDYIPVLDIDTILDIKEISKVFIAKEN